MPLTVTTCICFNLICLPGSVIVEACVIMLNSPRSKSDPIRNAPDSKVIVASAGSHASKLRVIPPAVLISPFFRITGSSDVISVVIYNDTIGTPSGDGVIISDALGIIFARTRSY